MFRYRQDVETDWLGHFAEPDDPGMGDIAVMNPQVEQAAGQNGEALYQLRELLVDPQPLKVRVELGQADLKLYAWMYTPKGVDGENTHQLSELVEKVRANSRSVQPLTPEGNAFPMRLDGDLKIVVPLISADMPGEFGSFVGQDLQAENRLPRAVVRVTPEEFDDIIPRQQQGTLMSFVEELPTGQAGNQTQPHDSLEHKPQRVNPPADAAKAKSSESPRQDAASDTMGDDTRYDMNLAAAMAAAVRAKDPKRVLDFFNRMVGGGETVTAPENHKPRPTVVPEHHPTARPQATRAPQSDQSRVPLAVVPPVAPPLATIRPDWPFSPGAGNKARPALTAAPAERTDQAPTPPRSRGEPTYVELPDWWDGPVDWVKRHKVLGSISAAALAASVLVVPNLLSGGSSHEEAGSGQTANLLQLGGQAKGAAKPKAKAKTGTPAAQVPHLVWNQAGIEVAAGQVQIEGKALLDVHYGKSGKKPAGWYPNGNANANDYYTDLGSEWRITADAVAPGAVTIRRQGKKSVVTIDRSKLTIEPELAQTDWQTKNSPGKDLPIEHLKVINTGPLKSGKYYINVAQGKQINEAFTHPNQQAFENVLEAGEVAVVTDMQNQPKVHARLDRLAVMAVKGAIRRMAEEQGVPLRDVVFAPVTGGQPDILTHYVNANGFKLAGSSPYIRTAGSDFRMSKYSPINFKVVKNKG